MEQDRPRATHRVRRAVRSLFLNRLLLERVLIRVERAEAIIASYLLAQGDLKTQIGPYYVELDECNRISLTPTEDDGWRQMRIPEVDTLSELALQDLREEPVRSQLRI